MVFLILWEYYKILGNFPVSANNGDMSLRTEKDTIGKVRLSGA
jgi:hypothetical protein